MAPALENFRALDRYERILIHSRKEMQSHSSVAHAARAQANMNDQHHMRSV